jgi:ubiquinone/menaquinone biosynthesis C-methylase UbiE
VTDIYVCPDCKTPLVNLRCSECKHQYESSGDFPVLLSNNPSFSNSREVAETYESIYSHHSLVWQDQGRTPEFVEYFKSLLAGFHARRFLEVGCGEGTLLAAVSANEKHGTDLSVQALRKASNKSSAQLCIALGERLPFRDEYFDLIASVGVMEHFLDPAAATREIWRMLRSGGHYVVLLHVHLTTWQSVRQKISEYVYPRPHPGHLVKWMARKLYRPIHQPIQNRYTTASAKLCLEQNGFAITKVIHKGNAPATPLIGSHVMIYVCQKPA